MLILFCSKVSFFLIDICKLGVKLSANLISTSGYNVRKFLRKNEWHLAITVQTGVKTRNFGVQDPRGKCFNKNACLFFNYKNDLAAYWGSWRMPTALSTYFREVFSRERAVPAAHAFEHHTSIHVYWSNKMKVLKWLFKGAHYTHVVSDKNAWPCIYSTISATFEHLHWTRGCV